MREAYPGASLSQDENGLWLSARSGVLSGIGREAIFLVALPNIPHVEPRGWAFWQQGDEIQWIGDRHTNFFDGSICAYSGLQDNAWKPGDDLRTLLDLYSVWALRHLHLTVFGRWVGRQYALLDPQGTPLPYYRLVEFHVDECCSCGSGKAYGACCRAGDFGRDFLTAKRQFEAFNGGRGIRDRKPPEAVTRYASAVGNLPAIIDVHEVLRARLAN